MDWKPLSGPDEEPFEAVCSVSHLICTRPLTKMGFQTTDPPVGFRSIRVYLDHEHRYTSEAWHCSAERKPITKCEGMNLGMNEDLHKDVLEFHTPIILASSPVLRIGRMRRQAAS